MWIWGGDDMGMDKSGSHVELRFSVSCRLGFDAA